MSRFIRLLLEEENNSPMNKVKLEEDNSTPHYTERKEVSRLADGLFRIKIYKLPTDIRGYIEIGAKDEEKNGAWISSDKISTSSKYVVGYGKAIRTNPKESGKKIGEMLNELNDELQKKYKNYEVSWDETELEQTFYLHLKK